MRAWIALGLGLLGTVSLTAAAQGPESVNLSKAGDVEDLITRMMAFDKNHDGKLTQSEVSDDRLSGLFDRADTDKSGDVTKEELGALGAKEHSDVPAFGGPGGPPPAPGEILPPMFQRMLKLTDAQKHEAKNLQLEVTASLEKILDSDQAKQLKSLRERRPGGGGPPRRGPGGPRMSFFAPGEVLSAGLIDELKLTDGQRGEVASLQKTVNQSLEKILDDDQEKEWKTIRERRPMGPPPGARPGGPR